MGIGVQGLADAFILMRFPFESPQAQLLNSHIFETIYHAALEASCELAAELGPYETYEGSPVSRGVGALPLSLPLSLSTSLPLSLSTPISTSLPHLYLFTLLPHLSPSLEQLYSPPCPAGHSLCRFFAPTMSYTTLISPTSVSSGLSR